MKNNPSLRRWKLASKLATTTLTLKSAKSKVFLEDGDRVKIMIIFRGREMAHKEIGQEMVDKIVQLISNEIEIVVEGKPQFAGRNLSISLRRK